MQYGHLLWRISHALFIQHAQRIACRQNFDSAICITLCHVDQRIQRDGLIPLRQGTHNGFTVFSITGLRLIHQQLTNFRSLQCRQHIQSICTRLRFHGCKLSADFLCNFLCAWQLLHNR